MRVGSATTKSSCSHTSRLVSTPLYRPCLLSIGLLPPGGYREVMPPLLSSHHLQWQEGWFQGLSSPPKRKTLPTCTCCHACPQVGTEGAFLQLTTADGSRLRLGPAQYIPAAASAAVAPAPVLAASIKPGQYIWVVDPANELALVASEVTAVSWVTAPGRILPVTLQGGLVVDAARVSGGPVGVARRGGGLMIRRVVCLGDGECHADPVSRVLPLKCAHSWGIAGIVALC